MGQETSTTFEPSFSQYSQLTGQEKAEYLVRCVESIRQPDHTRWDTLKSQLVEKGFPAAEVNNAIVAYLFGAGLDAAQVEQSLTEGGLASAHYARTVGEWELRRVEIEKKVGNAMRMIEIALWVMMFAALYTFDLGWISCLTLFIVVCGVGHLLLGPVCRYVVRRKIRKAYM